MRASSQGDIWSDSTHGEAHGRTGTRGRPAGGSRGAPSGTHTVARSRGQAPGAYESATCATWTSAQAQSNTASTLASALTARTPAVRRRGASKHR